MVIKFKVGESAYGFKRTLVCSVHTQCMEIAELLELVRKEWPERVKIIFAPGYDGMLVEKMRARVINKLRLGYEELKAMTDTGDDRDKKRFVVDYVRAVRPALMKVN